MLKTSKQRMETLDEWETRKKPGFGSGSFCWSSKGLSNWGRILWFSLLLRPLGCVWGNQPPLGPPAPRCPMSASRALPYPRFVEYSRQNFIAHTQERLCNKRK